MTDDRSNRIFGSYILFGGLLILLLANLFSPYDESLIIGTNTEDVLFDKVIIFVVLLITFVTLILNFIKCPDENINIVSGLYAIIVILTIFISLSFNVGYGILYTLLILLIITLLFVIRFSKQFYLVIPVVLLIVTIFLLRGHPFRIISF